MLTFVHSRVSQWWTWCSVASRYSSDWCCFLTWSPWHNYVDYCTVILFKWLNHYCITILCNHFPLIPYCNGSVAWTIKHSYSYSFTLCLVFHNNGTSTDSFRWTDFIFLGYFVNTTNTSWPRSHCYESFPAPLQLGAEQDKTSSLLSTCSMSHVWISSVAVDLSTGSDTFSAV